MIAVRIKRGKYVLRRGRVPKPHRQIPQPTLIPDPMYRASRELLLELFLRPGEQFDQRRGVETIPDREVGFAAR